MKKYIVLLFLSFVLVSCNKIEPQSINSELPNNTKQEFFETGNVLVVENYSIGNTGEIIEAGTGEIINNNKEKISGSGEISIETKHIFTDKELNLYKNEPYGFEFTYPKNWKARNQNAYFSNEDYSGGEETFYWQIAVNQTGASDIGNMSTEDIVKEQYCNDKILGEINNGVYYQGLCFNDGTFTYSFIKKINDKFIIFVLNSKQNNPLDRFKEIVSSVKETKIISDNNIPYTKWSQYKNSKLGISFSYPEKAYMETKCGSEDRELVDLKVFEEIDGVTVGYSKQLSNCKLIDSRGGDLRFKVFSKNLNKEDFVKNVYPEGICEIVDTEKWKNSDIINLFIEIKPEIINCIKNKTCNNYSSFDCTNDAYTIFDEKTKKGAILRFSTADYFIAKYKTYIENMDKGAYDNEIINTFQFN